MQEDFLSIIIVNFNGGRYLQYALKSIKLYPPSIPYEVIVVDNLSSDHSFEKAKICFPEFKYIKSKKNIGYGGGCNLGLRNAKGNLLVFANPDIVVKETGFDVLIREIQNGKSVAVIGPRLINPNGSFQPSCRRFPKFKYLFTGRRSLITRYIKGNPLSKEFMYLDFEKEDNPRDVESIMGAFILARREAVEKIGGFDENFFLFAEDIDLCYRLKKNAFKICYYPKVEVIHYHGRSRRYLGLKSIYFLRKSIYTFFKKHYRLNLLLKSILSLGIISSTAFSYFLAILGKKTD